MLRWHPCLLAGDIRGSQGDLGLRVHAGWGVGVSGDPEEAGRPRSCRQGSSQQPRELWAPSWGWRPGGVGRPTSVGGTGADTGCRPVPRTRVRSAERGPDAVAGGRPCVREKPESAALQPSVTWRHCRVSDGARPGAEAPAPRHTGQRRRALPPGSVGSRVRAGRGFAAAGHLPGPARRSHPDSLPHPCPGEPQGLSPRPLLRPRVHPLVPKPPRCSRSHGPLRAAPHCFPGSALGTSASVVSTGAIWGPSARLQGGLTRLGSLPDGCSGRGWPRAQASLCSEGTARGSRRPRRLWGRHGGTCAAFPWSAQVQGEDAGPGPRQEAAENVPSEARRPHSAPRTPQPPVSPRAGPRTPPRSLLRTVVPAVTVPDGRALRTPLQGCTRPSLGRLSHSAVPSRWAQHLVWSLGGRSWGRPPLSCRCRAPPASSRSPTTCGSRGRGGGQRVPWGGEFTALGCRARSPGDPATQRALAPRARGGQVGPQASR